MNNFPVKKGKSGYNVQSSYKSSEHVFTLPGRREKLSQELREMSIDNRYRKRCMGIEDDITIIAGFIIETNQDQFLYENEYNKLINIIHRKSVTLTCNLG